MKQNIDILVVSADEKNVKHLTFFLKPYLFNIISVSLAKEALSMLRSNNFRIIILDLLLSDMYGIELCKHIRSFMSNIPIVFLSKINDPTEIVLCFESGADDYIEIPYNQHILLSRLKAKIRKKNYNALSHISFNSINEININNYKCIKFGKWIYQLKQCLIIHPDYGEICLTDKENTLLKLLLSNPNRIFSRQKISKYLNLSGLESMIRDVNIHVYRLRNKLTNGYNSNSPVKAVRSQGYTMDSYLNYFYDDKALSCYN